MFGGSALFFYGLLSGVVLVLTLQVCAVAYGVLVMRKYLQHQRLMQRLNAIARVAAAQEPVSLPQTVTAPSHDIAPRPLIPYDACWVAQATYGRSH